MGILQSFSELKNIKELLNDNHLRGYDINFDDNTFYVNEKDEKVSLISVRLECFSWTDELTFKIEMGNEIFECKENSIPRPLITLAYLKLQKYKREFNQD